MRILAFTATARKPLSASRVLRAGLQEAFRQSPGGGGKGLARLIHFAPFALRALKDVKAIPDKPK